jgi:hypothetical protein
MKFFKSRKPHFEHLRKRWVGRHKTVTQNLFDKHLRKAAAGTLGGLMLLTTPALSIPSHQLLTGTNINIVGVEDKNRLLAAQLIDKIPSDMRNLSAEEEKQMEKMLSRDFGFTVKAEIDGKRLNRTYGMIGGEQHLYRYPGDTLHAHAKDAQDWAMYGPSGIAPGLGAWGYFAPSKAEFTQKDEERERYYLAVQTFLSPGFAERVKEYRDFYKFRKMLVVNPKTGQAVIAVIGDAGPGASTGKHLGGSPEVMHYLGVASGPRKGAVLYYFVDDPEDKIPLGPIKVKESLIAKR